MVYIMDVRIGSCDDNAWLLSFLLDRDPRYQGDFVEIGLLAFENRASLSCR